MRSAVISLGSKSSIMTANAMKKYFKDVDELNIKEIEVKLTPKGTEVIYRGEKMPEYDCIYVKGSYKYVQIMRSITSVSQKSIYMPIHDNAFTIGHDKLLTHLMLEQEDVPMPATYITSSTKGASLLLERLNYPIVIKFPSSTQGKGVTFAESLSSAKSILDAFASLNQPVILQEFIDAGGEDIRAFIVGNKVVAAMKRKAIEGEKRSNIHAGGSGELIELDLETKQIAIKVAKIINADICGVDILLGPNGPKVIEVNLSPGLQGITEATGIDVADKIARFLYNETKKFYSVDSLPEGKAVENSTIPKIVTTIDFSKGQLKIPEIVAKFAGFSQDDEVTVSTGKNTVVITKNKK